MENKSAYKAILIIKTQEAQVIQPSDIVYKLRSMGFTVANNAFQECAPFVLEINDSYDYWRK